MSSPRNSTLSFKWLHNEAYFCWQTFSCAKESEISKQNNNKTSKKHSFAVAPSNYRSNQPEIYQREIHCVKVALQHLFSALCCWSRESQSFFFIAERESRARKKPAVRKIYLAQSSVRSEAFYWVDGFRKSLHTWKLNLKKKKNVLLSVWKKVSVI